MAGQKFLAHGTTVTFSSADIGGLETITFPTRSRGEAETTDNDSSGDREYIPGLRDGGEVTLEGRYIPGDSGLDALETNYESDTLGAEEVVITLPDQATDDSTVHTATFDAFVTGFEVDLPQAEDEVGSYSATLKVTGGVTTATA